MTQYTPSTLVIGGGPNGLGVMRSLGRNGINVFALVDDASNVAIYSKYCKGFATFPQVEADYQMLQRSLMALEKRFTGRVYLHPTGDLSVLNIAKMIDHNRLSPKYVTALPDKEVIETLVNKKKFYRSLTEHRVPHPHTLYVDDDDFKRKLREIRFPVFVKPSISHQFMRIFRGKKGFVATTERELHTYLKLMTRHHLEAVVQQIIVGPSKNNVSICGYFDKNSKPMILVARQRVRQPSAFSVHTIIVSIPLTAKAR
jgi:predicted ATP-grasp superfamily ATP-dependent carboligase